MLKYKFLKKLIVYISLSFFISLFLTFIYIFFPKIPDSFDNRLRDHLFKARGELPNNDNIVIVDIDEKSLEKIGQWPWSRNVLSNILQNLNNSNVGIIGFDVVFAEEDNSSPHKILKKYNINNLDAPNYDVQFAKTIATTPTILGYQFILEKDKKFISKNTPEIPCIFIEKNKSDGKDYLINGYGTILNTPILQDNSYSSGFFNNIPDESGIIRSVPLIISNDDTIFPSLSLEILRIITQSKKVIINYNENGVESIKLNDISIPTDRHGRLLVNFRGEEKNFKYISALDILDNTFKKEDIEGKIVLIGTSAAGLLDLRATPFDFVFPGVEVHANVIDNILMQDFIYKPSWADGANVILIFLISLIVVLLVTYTPFWINPFLTLIFTSGIIYLIYESLFSYGIVLNIIFPIITIVMAFITATLFDYFYEVKKEEAIKKKFASKVSKEVMESLLKNIDSNEFHAMEKEVTVFFSDVRGFTNISEQMPSASDLIEYLNKYMEPMSNIIIENQGTIDKYIGDAIMAYWNAPGDIKNHADKALKASILQIKQLDSLNEFYKQNNKPLIDIGIGLNTGSVIVGEMGSIGRSDYTVIGDPINLGARLESLCKHYNSKINISNFTKEKLKEKYIFRFLDFVRVKGKKEPVEIWQVIDFGEAKDKLKEELDLYHKGIELYKKSKFSKALEIFTELENNEHKTNKNIYGIYIKRCKEYIKTPPENFDGVYEHTSKG